jgi:hypothetical protein
MMVACELESESVTAPLEPQDEPQLTCNMSLIGAYILSVLALLCHITCIAMVTDPNERQVLSPIAQNFNDFRIFLKSFK